MQYFRTLAIGLLLVSCATDEPEMETTPAVPEATGEKIAGGSVLQVFFLRGNQTKGTDIVDRTNANWLAMSPLISLEQQNSGEFRPYEFPVSQETFKMREAIETVLSSGVRNIMLKPLTSFAAISDSDFWGDFFLETEEEWQEMENAYSDLFLGFAALSEAFPQVRMLSIGNELREFAVRRPRFFRELITRLRVDYPNLKLTYAANWDEYDRISFWEDLDYIGLNSYFPLVDKKTPQVDEIKEAFVPVKNDILTVARNAGVPVLFTEYGFRSIDYNVRRPWDHGPVQIGVNVNLQAQSNAYTAFFETFWDEPWVAGGFFWEWYVEIDIFNPVFISTENGWYINGKPAEAIVRERYSRGAD